MATTQPAFAQCTGCHENIAREAATARFKHSPVLNDRACLNCHTPHGGNVARLVKDVPGKVCMSCHNQPQKTARGTLVAAMMELMDPAKFKHGALHEGDCSGCHSAHGGDRASFQTKNYSQIFYQSFSPELYQLCFSCHDSGLVRVKRTTKLTSFRNGDVNLHSIHVDAGARGENCRVCHDSHASPNERNVRDRVKYGVWQMPIRFSKTATGGSCFPGCHPAYGYDRERPLANPKSPPPSTQLTAARSDMARTLQWHGLDVVGSICGFPIADRASVIVFVKPNDPATLRVLEMIEIALRDDQDAQVIVFAAGTSASPQSFPKPWHVVNDPDGTFAAEMGVHGWPVTMVVNNAGLELVRLTGARESLAMRLSPYLALAMGKIDQTAATTRASDVNIIDNGKRVRNSQSTSREATERK
jgi:predicted CXXCH cytochrome family protein